MDTLSKSQIKDIATTIAIDLYGLKSLSKFSFFKFYGDQFIGLPTLQLTLTQMKFLIDILPTHATIGISPFPGSPELCIRFLK